MDLIGFVQRLSDRRGAWRKGPQLSRGTVAGELIPRGSPHDFIELETEVRFTQRALHDLKNRTKRGADEFVRAWKETL